MANIRIDTDGFVDAQLQVFRTALEETDEDDE